MGPNSIIAGLAATFRTGAANALDHNAIVKDVTALHMMIFHPSPFSPFDTTPPISVSTVIATLRRLLLNAESSKTETGRWFKRAAEVRVNPDVPYVPLIFHIGFYSIGYTSG